MAYVPFMTGPPQKYNADTSAKYLVFRTGYDGAYNYQECHTLAEVQEYIQNFGDYQKEDEVKVVEVARWISLKKKPVEWRLDLNDED